MIDAVEIQSVTCSFGRATALDDVTLVIPEGSICGLLGRNGAGKTTLMSLIAGQDRPSSGRIRVLGENPYESEEALSHLIFMRDNQKYPDNYRLKHVLRIAPDFAPDWSAEVAAELVDGLRIPTTTQIKKFSRGQLSSVAIVLGFASRAPVTILDEPYLGLDVTARSLFHDMLLRDYAAHPRTVVLSTHHVDESEALFDRVAILDRGRLCVDAVSGEIPDLAFTLSGPTDAVVRLASGQTVLSRTGNGGLTSVTLEGRIDDRITADARTLGIRVAPASLQDIVAAYGTDTAEPAQNVKGVRA